MHVRVISEVDARKGRFASGHLCAHPERPFWRIHATDFWATDTRKVWGKSRMHATYIPDARNPFNLAYTADLCTALAPLLSRCQSATKHLSRQYTSLPQIKKKERKKVWIVDIISICSDCSGDSSTLLPKSPWLWRALAMASNNATRVCALKRACHGSFAKKVRSSCGTAVN